MPELPEVETVARQLRPLLSGRTVRGLRIFDPRLRNGRSPSLAGRSIVEVHQNHRLRFRRKLLLHNCHQWKMDFRCVLKLTWP